MLKTRNVSHLKGPSEVNVLKDYVNDQNNV